VGEKLKHLLLTSGPAHERELNQISTLKKKYRLANRMGDMVTIDAMVMLEQACDAPGLFPCKRAHF
jgi:hypothetical protein